MNDASLKPPRHATGLILYLLLV